MDGGPDFFFLRGEGGGQQLGSILDRMCVDVGLFSMQIKWCSYISLENDPMGKSIQGRRGAYSLHGAHGGMGSTS